MAAMTFLGFYLIVAQFAGVDLASMLADAQWSWVVLAGLLSFVPQFSGSVALMGAVSRPLPFGPVLAEQFANNFTGLIGGTTATTALVIRFFQKQGLKVAVAASSGVLNSLAGGIVQFVLVVVGLLVSDTHFVPSDGRRGRSRATPPHRHRRARRGRRRRPARPQAPGAIRRSVRPADRRRTREPPRGPHHAAQGAS